MASRLFSPAGKLLKQINVAPSFVRASSNGIGYKQAIANYPATQLSIMDNSMRVVTEEMNGPMASVGVYIDAGSRYETEKNNGVGKFLERMSFKGTSKRSAVDLEMEVASMGARIESCTGREQTSFVGHCQNKDIPKMVEILADIVQNSSLDSSEVERQRGAIIKQMAEPEDMATIVNNHMHSIAFQGTPLGLNASGSSESIKQITTEDLISYRNNSFCAPRMVLAGAGDISHSTLTDLASQHFGKLQADDSSPILPPYCRYTGSEMRMRDDDMPYAHIALAVKGCGYNDPDYLVLQLAATLLGSWKNTQGGALNSSFKLARACTIGNLAESYDAFNLTYKDTGLFGVNLVSHQLTIEDLMYNVYQELMRFCETVTDFDVERAKNILRTRIMLEQSNPAALCQAIGSDTLNLGRKVPLSELDAAISEIDGTVFRDVCTKYIYDKCPVVVGIGCIEQLFTYVNIRSNFYWLRV